MNRDILVEYANYKSQITELEKKIDFIKSEVKQEIVDIYDPEHPPELEGYGTFTLKPVPIWADTPEITKLKEKIKELEAHNKATKDADTVRVDLVFTKAKNV